MTAEKTPEPACSRCHGTPAPNSASSICPQCDPGTPLCQGCYVQHAREVLAELAESGPDPATDFYRSTLRREQLQMAADVVAIADRATDTPAQIWDTEYKSLKNLAANYIRTKPVDLPGEGFTIPVIEGGPE